MIGPGSAVVQGKRDVSGTETWSEQGERLVGYWIDRDFWGRGIATAALSLFLLEQPDRPLSARVAKHNSGSIRVLQKCGFVATGEGAFPGPDGRPVEEYLFTLV